jgi:hypothetical protein
MVHEEDIVHVHLRRIHTTNIVKAQNVLYNFIFEMIFEL